MNHALVNTFINVLNAANRIPFLIVQQDNTFSQCQMPCILFALNEMFTQAPEAEAAMAMAMAATAVGVSTAIPIECNINVFIRRSQANWQMNRSRCCDPSMLTHAHSHTMCEYLYKF